MSRRVSGELLRGGDSQDVATLILGMASVAFDHCEAALVLLQQFVESLPELDVHDGLPAAFLAAPPAVLFPVRHPFRAAFGNVRAVGDDFDLRATFQCRQTLDHGHQLHLIVGRFREPPRTFSLGTRLGMAQDVRPASRSRIAAAGAISKQLNRWQAGVCRCCVGRLGVHDRVKGAPREGQVKTGKLAQNLLLVMVNSA